MTLLDIATEISSEVFAERVEPLRGGGEKKILLETVHRRKDGTNYPVEVNLQSMPGDPPVFLAISIDITERKQAAERLGFLSAIAEQVTDSIVVSDMDFRIVYVNSAAQALFGYTDEELIGRTPYILNAEPISKQIKEERNRVVLSGESYTGEVRNKRKDGTIFICEYKVSQMLNESGEIDGYIGIQHDITERKQAEVEREKMQAQLNQSQKMESIGQLAGGVAHDFNNKLQVILGLTEMAIDEVLPESNLYDDLIEIRKAGNSSADLTRQLLAFARKQNIIPKVLDLNDTVSGMLKMLLRLIGENIELVWLPASGDTTVKMDPSQIDQLLANLCVNSCDALEGEGKITVATGTLSADAATCAGHEGAVPGEYVTLAVSDTGCGMGPETLEHLFEPFFTTKGVGEGPGLGLATMYGIVRQNKGFITVQSELGKGATFMVCLPRYLGKAERLPASGPAPVPLRGHETVLLVEDEPPLLAIGKRMLESLGYQVLTTCLPEEAIALAESQVGEIHLLLTDVIMPKMNGMDLAAHLSLGRPELKHMFMSGYTADIITKQGIVEEGVHFIQKPFTIQDIAAKVREALDSR